MKEKSRIKYIAGILLLLYVGYCSCVSLFVHTHIYNGVVYVHSHPFQDDSKHKRDYGKQNHNHSSAAFSLLGQLSSTTSFQADNTLPNDVVRPLYILPYKTRVDNVVILQTSGQNHLRAPPLFI